MTARPSLLLWLLLLLAAAWPAAAMAELPQPALRCEAERPALAAQGFARMVERNAAAVVTVIVIRQQRSREATPEGAIFFQPMSGFDPGEAARATTGERSFASGFVLSPQGEVLTSAHAVHDALEIWVELADGRRVAARVLGFDLRDDVALLKIESPDLRAVQVAPQVPVCAGDWVVALGSPFGFESTVSAGVVSTYPRVLPGGNGVPLIQTDVVLNPGSSGGPLFNAAGGVVGMNSMIYSDTGIYMGLSFAVPIARVLRIAAELRSADGRRRVDPGMRTQPLTGDLALAFGLDGKRGLLVTTTEAGGAAEQAGVRSGDVLLAIDGQPVLPHEQLDDRLAQLRAGESVTLDIWRQRAVRQLKLRGVDSATAQAARQAPTPRNPELRLGLVLGSAPGPSAAGVHVESASGSALLAGIEPGDRIVAVNGTAVVDLRTFDLALAREADQAVVALLVSRLGASMYLPVRSLGR